MRRTYSRASTDDQDATRARETLRTFAGEHGARIAATYVENASGTLLNRRELLRLLADAERGDVLLVEAVDRLSRLDRATWDQLRDRIAQAGLQVVSLDLPLTHALIRPATVGGDGLQEWMTRALSQMFLEFMGAFARKDSETRRARAAQGIAKVKAARVYKGRPRVSSCMRGSANAWPGGCRCGGRRGY
ncbi:recombinase family protein [Pseudomonas oryzihabitans]|uniref:recombinase family protein n=1 Tax=Pseudomonas oryzihabitans TaxID=47885 RepID=UPI003CEC1EB9